MGPLTEPPKRRKSLGRYISREILVSYKIQSPQCIYNTFAAMFYEIKIEFANAFAQGMDCFQTIKDINSRFLYHKLMT